VRLIKMLGLAAVAAIAATAFIGVSSAMATELEEVVLCKLDVVNCPHTEHFASGTVLHAHLAAGTSAVLLSDVNDVTCTGSTTLGQTNELRGTNAHGNVLDGKITALAFSGCTSGGFNCNVTAEHLNYLALVLLNASSEFHVVVEEEGTNGKPQAFVSCGGGFVKCKFATTAALFSVELLSTGGGAPLDIDLVILQELERITGAEFLCGNTSVWHAKYLTLCLEGSNEVGCWPAMLQEG
jgi:hypothetical protein